MQHGKIIETIKSAKQILECAEIPLPFELLQAIKETEKENPDFDEIMNLLATLRENNRKDMQSMILGGVVLHNEKSEFVIPKTNVSSILNKINGK